MLMRTHGMRRFALIVAATALPALAGADDYQLDPFEQATAGFAACPTVPPPTLTPEQMRAQAHSRVERVFECEPDGEPSSGGPRVAQKWSKKRK